MLEGSDQNPNLLLVDPDQDPGGPKTCGSGGSGSGTLLKAHLDHKADVHGGAGSDGDHVNVPDVLRPNLPEK
jgi:hypothetical protein